MSTGARPDTWMPWYIGDYLADTMHLSCLEHGAYLLLIAAYWRGGKALPDDDKKLSRITRTTMSEWASLRPTLVEFFHIADSFWRHKRIDAELMLAASNKERNKQRASNASAARWASRKDANSIHEAPTKQCLSNALKGEGEGSYREEILSQGSDGSEPVRLNGNHETHEFDEVPQ